jgi:hypothetical protein
MINLHVEPKQIPMDWEEFVGTKPKYSIALDGYVNVGPRFLASGPYLNLNHHEEVDRLATRATCAQTLLAIRQGLFTTFKQSTGAVANVYVNDCDEDVCTSWFLLKNHYLVNSSMNPQINKLVHMEDLLDSTSGCYPFPADLDSLHKLAWVFNPYRSFRLNGGLNKKQASEYREVISDVERRIMAFINGAAESIEMDFSYEILGGGKSWKLVKETGSHGRAGIIADGVTAFISVREHSDGKTFTYTIGKISPFVNFDILGLYKHLNEVEFENQNQTKDIWGGGNLIGGSPRVNGSKLQPKQIEEIVNRFLETKAV